MISIKGINKYTKYEKAELKRVLHGLLEDTFTSCTKFFVNCYECKDCEYKHLCKDIYDLLKSGILDESEVK